jgi:two-component system nitrate/nitrite response regulator NarL
MTMAMNAADDLFDPAHSTLLTVTLVDGQRLFMRGLTVLLESESGGDIQVVGATDSGADALELVRRCQPHIAIVDVSVGTPGGVPSIRDLKRHYPWIRVLATSASNDSEIAGVALRAGADGFIPKSSNPEGFVAALRSLAGGYCVMPDQVFSELVGARRHHGVADELSAGERPLWRLIAEGLETREIASRLFLSERTTKRRIAVLMVRLGVSSRVQAAALAGQCGILND